MKRISFFTTGEDIKKVISLVEGELSLHYVNRRCNNAGDDNPILTSGLDIEKLGCCNSEGTSSSRGYLLAEQTNELKKRCVKMFDGGLNCSYDQLINPQTVFFISWRDLRER